MKMLFQHKSLPTLLLYLGLLLTGGFQCKKYLTADTGADLLPASEVFRQEGTANNAITGIYRTLRDQLFGSNTQTLYTGLSGDELFNFTPNPAYDDYRLNAIQPSNASLPWSHLYNVIYQANQAIAELENVSTLSVTAKNQFLGEAHFLRGFAYWYLVNLFGEVPLLTKPVVQENANAPRATVDAIYDQMITDLLQAERLLTTGYTYSLGERTRANQLTASALLARIYLYRRDWVNADKQATKLISSNSFKLLGELDSFAIKNNVEAIFQCANASNEGNYEPTYFIFSSTPNILVTNSLLNAFEPGDRRRTKWIKAGTYQGNPYYYPYKYKLANIPGNEYYTVMRLGEQYLIRAEARAQLNQFAECLADLNFIRQRANLPVYTGAITLDALVKTIIRERRVELFAETGHRWMDLKRTGMIDSVMTAYKPATWKHSAALYPLPLSDILVNTKLTQNPGY